MPQLNEAPKEQRSTLEDIDIPVNDFEEIWTRAIQKAGEDEQVSRIIINSGYAWLTSLPNSILIQHTKELYEMHKKLSTLLYKNTLEITDLPASPFAKRLYFGFKMEHERIGGEKYSNEQKKVEKENFLYFLTLSSILMIMSYEMIPKYVEQQYPKKLKELPVLLHTRKALLHLSNNLGAFNQEIEEIDILLKALAPMQRGEPMERGEAVSNYLTHYISFFENESHDELQQKIAIEAVNELLRIPESDGGPSNADAKLFVERFSVYVKHAKIENDPNNVPGEAF